MVKESGNDDKQQTAGAQSGADEPAAEPAADGADEAAAKPAVIYIELQRTLTGWGQKDQILEVEHTDEIDRMIGNELAVRVAKKDLTQTADGWALSSALAG